MHLKTWKYAGSGVSAVERTIWNETSLMTCEWSKWRKQFFSFTYKLIRIVSLEIIREHYSLSSDEFTYLSFHTFFMLSGYICRLGHKEHSPVHNPENGWIVFHLMVELSCLSMEVLNLWSVLIASLSSSITCHVDRFPTLFTFIF